MKRGDWVQHTKSGREGVIVSTDGETAVVMFPATNWPFPVHSKMLIAGLRVVRKAKKQSPPDGEPALL